MVSAVRISVFMVSVQANMEFLDLPIAISCRVSTVFPMTVGLG